MRSYMLGILENMTISFRLRLHSRFKRCMWKPYLHLQMCSQATSNSEAM